MVRVMNKNLADIIEWATWANLDKLTELELILLKGHLHIEIIIDTVLSENGIRNCEDLSFFKKTKKLKIIESKASGNSQIITDKLFELNKIRNKLAHELKFDIKNGEFENWAQSVLSIFKGQKFTKHTYRTKIVHAFSTIAKAITEM